MKYVLILLALTCLLLLFNSCPDVPITPEPTPSPTPTPTPMPNSRSFHMGFTPWPYAATLEAISNTYGVINNDGDLAAHHFQQGIPFGTTSGSLSNYADNIQDEINGRISNTDSSLKLYLAIDSLNSARNDLTDYWGTSSNMSRVSPWDTRSFDDSEVIAAYSGFAIDVITAFETTFGLPECFNYGPEISDLMLNDSEKFTEYLLFASGVHTNLKTEFPDLDLMVSIALKSPGSTDMATVTSGFDQIKDYVDIVGISTYGYVFYGHADAGNPANLPANWLTQITDIAPDKPYAVVETGWPAQDLVISNYSINTTCTPAWQDQYLSTLCTEAHNELQASLLIWFTPYDYDTLWNDTLGQDDVSRIWRDTGLIDENLDNRTALTTWRNWLGYTKQ